MNVTAAIAFAFNYLQLQSVEIHEDPHEVHRFPSRLLNALCLARDRPMASLVWFAPWILSHIT